MERQFYDRFEARQLAIKKMANKVSDSTPENNNPRSKIIAQVLKAFQKEEDTFSPQN